MRLLSIIFCGVLSLSVCNGYRILGLFPFFGKSHFIMFEPLMKGLANRGHQVDVISPFPLKKPFENYTDLITIRLEKQYLNNLSYQEMNKLVVSFPVLSIVNLAGNNLCEFLGNPELQKLVRNPPQDPPYDAILIETLGANCFGVIGHLWKVPVIGLSSSVLYPWSHSLIANPENLAFSPNNLLSFSPQMNFWERLYNVVHTWENKLYFNYGTKVQDDIIRKHFGEDMPGIRELETKISLILVNSHFSMNGPKPTTPALVEVGGLHVQDDGTELPTSLEKWMNESTDGFVYFTFGSMVQIESFPPKYLEIFYNSLGKIAPVRVLMKIPNPSKLPPGLPKNILTQSWMPQVKVLKHRNIKAFITHGGLMGTQEAIHYGVPMIGMPLFADQFINIETYVRKNIAIKLDLDTLTEEKMDEALNAMLNDPIYRDAARKMSNLFLDRPMSAIDTSNYWIEYIIRNGENALRSPAMDMPFWKVELLDVYAFLLLVALIAIYILVALIKFVCSLIFPYSSNYRVPHSKKVT